MCVDRKKEALKKISDMWVRPFFGSGAKSTIVFEEGILVTLTFISPHGGSHGYSASMMMNGSYQFC